MLKLQQNWHKFRIHQSGLVLQIVRHTFDKFSDKKVKWQFYYSADKEIIDFKFDAHRKQVYCIGVKTKD